MDIEFHYYITYILARRAEFSQDDSALLAYSSQYTDDNTYHYCINFAKTNPYLNIVSQTMDITKPNAKRKWIYPIFHFFPGDPDSPLAARKDGRTDPFNTTPNGRNVKLVFEYALNSNNLYRIGIATHVYADTWAHQNFCGSKDDFNSMKTLGTAFVPDIGHADAGHNPDMFCHEWEDNRLVSGNSRINNNERFLEAAQNIFIAFKKHNNPNINEDMLNASWKDLKGQLLKVIDKESGPKDPFDSSQKARIRGYMDICSDIPGYDEDTWRHATVDKDPAELDYFDKYWGKSNFRDSHWYLFQEAAKTHHDISMEVLAPLYT
jgi:hypothetical protein